jgi:hypothetical protein
MRFAGGIFPGAVRPSLHGRKHGRSSTVAHGRTWSQSGSQKRGNSRPILVMVAGTKKAAQRTAQPDEHNLKDASQAPDFCVRLSPWHGLYRDTEIVRSLA